jgi:hypothetical protein
MLRNIKAAPGRVIRIPGKPGAMLDCNKWIKVEFDSYWARRERCGDIIAEPLPVRHPRPDPVSAPAPAVAVAINEPKKAPAKKAPAKKAPVKKAKK